MYAQPFLKAFFLNRNTQWKVNSTLVKCNGCIPLGTAVLFIKRMKMRGSNLGGGGNPEWSARRVLREEPKSASICRLPCQMNGTFYHEAMGILEWEETEYPEIWGCISGQRNAGTCSVTPNALKKQLKKKMAAGRARSVVMLQALMKGWELGDKDG